MKSRVSIVNTVQIKRFYAYIEVSFVSIMDVTSMELDVVFNKVRFEVHSSAVIGGRITGLGTCRRNVDPMNIHIMMI